MATSTFLMVFLSLIVSVLISFLFYYYKQKKQPKFTIILFILRSLSLFLIGLLIINPKFEFKTYKTIKPTLNVLLDNSKSINYFNESKNLKNWVNNLKKSKKLSEHFDIQFYSFDKTLKATDLLNYKGSNTTISEPIQQINAISKDKIAPILLLTDGNQTAGNSLDFITSKQVIYPIVFGDTMQYDDLNIQQINVNKYSTLKNKFPVEILVNYTGKKDVSSKLTISTNQSILFTKTISFSKSKSSEYITTFLESTKIGKQIYTVSISPLKNEKNTINNSKTFGIEVVDEQSKVLLLSSILHPDLGALKKAIESNQQKKVDIKLIQQNDYNLVDYQIFILYHPNNLFKDVVEKLNANSSHFWLITGTATDWNFISKNLNEINKNYINQIENYSAVFNPNFQTFFQENIGFENFSPLTDLFGKINILREHQTLLYQNVNGIETNQPLIATIENLDIKHIYLFGEGIWKWRSQYFLTHKNFSGFDQFINSILQYISNAKKRKRLELNYENVYPSNSTISISAYYFDANYQFDPRANIEVKIYGENKKEVKNLPFSLKENSYQLEINDLKAGTYTFKVNVTNQNIAEQGDFKVEPYEVEQQFTSANVQGLKKLADVTNGKFYYKNQFQNIENELVTNKAYIPIQIENISSKQFIDWKWILVILSSLLAVEWFIRKYFGKI